MPYIEPQSPPVQHSFRVSVYYADEEENLKEEIHLIDLDNTAFPEFGIIQQLIDGPSGALLRVIEEASLNYVYIVQNTAYVDVTLKEPQSLALFARASARTLNEAYGVAYLILTENGHMPKEANSGVVACAQTEENPHYVQLFFPDTRGQYIVPAIRHVSKDTEQYTANEVFEALIEGPSNTDLTEAMDKGVGLIRAWQSDQTLSLYLRMPEESDIDLYGYACIAMSMMRNIPDIHEVMINVNDDWVRDVPGINEEGCFTLDSTQDILGGLVELYFAGADGASLVGVTRSVALTSAADPLTAVREIIRGPLDTETGILNVLPASVNTDDVISLKRNGDLVVLNLTDSFYLSCQALSEEAEKLLLYSIVNALTERLDIRAVLFLNEGENVETLSGIISLHKPLLRNPGLILGQ